MDQSREPSQVAAVGVEGGEAIASEAASISKVSKQRRIEHALSVASPVALLLLWQAGSDLGAIDTRFFSSPAAIFAEMGNMIVSGELWIHLSISLQRVALGVVFGCIPAIIIGLAMGLIGPIRALLQPLVDATFPIPKTALLPLVILIFGLGEASKIAIIAIAVFYLVLINTVAGVMNIEKIYFDVGKNYRATRWMMFLDIALPGALPMVVAGLKLSMGVALMVLVAAEFVGATSGIGYLIWTSWQVFQVEEMYVGLMVSAIVGFSLAILLRYLERLLIPWRQS